MGLDVDDVTNLHELHLFVEGAFVGMFHSKNSFTSLF